MVNTRRQMPIEKFGRIVQKSIAEGIDHIGLFNWIEPFLCKDLEQYVRAVCEAGLTCGLSSSLSLPRIDALESVLVGVETLLVSMSGYDQDIYEVNHVGGRVAWVEQNLERIAVLRRSGRIKTYVVLKFIRFDYNVQEESKLQSLAERLGFAFEVLDGSGHPKKWSMAGTGAQVASSLTAFRSGRDQEPVGHVCPMIFEHVSLDADGEAFLCCAIGNFDNLKIGPYLDLTPEEILFRRYTHPFCNACLWTRRPAEPNELRALQQAFASHLGEPIGRVKRQPSPLAIV